MQAALREGVRLSDAACILQIRRALVRIEVAIHSSDRGYFDDQDIEDLDDNAETPLKGKD